MRISEDIRPVTYMKMKSAALLRDLGENRRPIVITQNGEAKAVILDVESYQSLRDAAILMKLVSQSEASARRGASSPQSGVFDRIAARIAAAREKTAKPERSTRSRRKRR